MKKVLLCFVLCFVLCLVSSVAFADYGLETLLNKYHSSVSAATEGTPRTHRSALTANDSFTYGSGDGDKVNLTGYKRVKVLCDIGGTASSWDLTPYYGDSTLGMYFSGDTRTITGDDEIYVLDVNGEDEFIINAANSQSATAATLTIYLMPFNN